MEEEDKLPKKKTLLVGLGQVINGIISVLCSVAIHYLPHYDYPVKSSSYGVWGGLTVGYILSYNFTINKLMCQLLLPTLVSVFCV